MLTDAQILACFKSGGLSDSNGQHCCRMLYENGIISTSRMCKGHAKVQNGKVTLHDACGEPCSWVCDDTQKFAIAVEQLQFFDKLITGVKDGRK